MEIDKYSLEQRQGHNVDEVDEFCSCIHALTLMTAMFTVMVNNDGGKLAIRGRQRLIKVPICLSAGYAEIVMLPMFCCADLCEAVRCMVLAKLSKGKQSLTSLMYPSPNQSITLGLGFAFV